MSGPNLIIRLCSSCCNRTGSSLVVLYILGGSSCIFNLILKEKVEGGLKHDEIRQYDSYSLIQRWCMWHKYIKRVEDGDIIISFVFDGGKALWDE